MDSGSNWSKLGLYMNLVYSFPATAMAGGGIGWLVDRFLGTKPWFTVTGFLVGLAGGFVLLFRTIQMIQRRRGNE